ncbi:MAG: hypothetical protein JNM57_11760 [Cyclobacteriaceae bacterium]|nr:hypothetical protein [Cyclobacteriaceae bacterium]
MGSISDNQNELVDLSRIHQKKVREFVRAFGLHSETGFQAMGPVCHEQHTTDFYREHCKTFLIKRNINEVWGIYKTINPKEAWRGGMVSFGLQYSRKKNAVTYQEDPYEGMESGQVIILNLKLLGGIFNMAVAHEITEVNDATKSFRLCYVQGGASKGSQYISLQRTPEDFTEVTHHTYYKGSSFFRDIILYPIFHSIAITEFHGNIAAMR